MSGESGSSSMEITLSDMRDNMEHTADPTEEFSLPGVSGEPKMLPRVGDKYQAVVPDLIGGNDLAKIEPVVNSRLLELPIPLMWAPNKARDTETLRGLGGVDPYVEENQVSLNSENGSISTHQAEKAADTRPMNRMKLDAISCEGPARQLAKVDKILYPLPGTSDERWSDFERDSFLLALYIFGKDLYLVKKFVETKNMADVISFYYGPFYKCKEYQRWAKCLRSRSRKSIHGQRIFTRGRQQELFSRLDHHISEETSNKLVEVSKMFKEEEISFEEYVFTLKDLVGTKLLIEVVAIGKGKQDLTGISSEPRKQNQSLSARKETQQDNGLSSLSCREITEQLTGSRLSKTKSNELFWEAVWPRLLAGGWHSEQPKDHGVLTLKHQLVFLMPGVKKFRRNKHVKGQHYFDSVSDILNKVASDPRILELENEKEKDIGHDGIHFDEHDLGLPNGKHNGYLKSCNSDQQKYKMEFMIVDTSKPQGSKVRCIKSLPLHAADISTSSSACSETGSDSSSQKSDGEGEETCANKTAQMANGNGSLKKQEVDSIDKKNKNSRKHRLGRTTKYLTPLKRHQVNAAGGEDLTEITQKKKDGDLILCLPNPHKVKESKQSQKGLDTQLSHPNSSHVISESSHFHLPQFLPKSDERDAFMACESSKEKEKSPEQSLPRVVIDLNIPQVPEDVVAYHDIIHHPACLSSLTENTSLAVKHKDSRGSHTLSPRKTTQQPQQVSDSNLQQPLKIPEEQEKPKIQQKQQLPKAQQEQQSNTLGRRQSSRNRPLTTKALEALESSFLEVNKKRKAMESSTSKPSRRKQRGNSKSNSTSESGIGSNELTEIRTEEESATGNSGNAPIWSLPPPQMSTNLQLQLH